MIWIGTFKIVRYVNVSSYLCTFHACSRSRKARNVVYRRCKAACILLYRTRSRHNGYEYEPFVISRPQINEYDYPIILRESSLLQILQITDLARISVKRVMEASQQACDRIRAIKIIATYY